MSSKSIHMWECGLLVFTVLFTLITAQTPTPEPYDKLASYWFSKCRNETKSEKAFDKLYADGVEFKRYLKYAFKFIPEEKRVFCDSERGALLNKLKELTVDLRPCLGPNEKYLEDFLYSSFKEFLHFLCHNSAENIKTFFSPNAAECRGKLLNGSDPQVGECLVRLSKPLSSGQPSKKELCGDFNVVKACFSEVLSHQCPSYGAYKRLNEDFFKYISTPCSGCAFYLNTLLLTISLIASYLFSR